MWICVFCGSPVSDAHSACCGEVGHTEWSHVEFWSPYELTQLQPKKMDRLVESALNFNNEDKSIIPSQSKRTIKHRG